MTLLSLRAVPRWSVEASSSNYNMQLGDDGRRILPFLLDCLFSLCVLLGLVGSKFVLERNIPADELDYVAAVSRALLPPVTVVL